MPEGVVSESELELELLEDSSSILELTKFAGFVLIVWIVFLASWVCDLRRRILLAGAALVSVVIGLETIDSIVFIRETLMIAFPPYVVVSETSGRVVGFLIPI